MGEEGTIVARATPKGARTGVNRGRRKCQWGREKGAGMCGWTEPYERSWKYVGCERIGRGILTLVRITRRPSSGKQEGGRTEREGKMRA